MGRVQHYYRTKDDLLIDSLRRAHQELERYIKGRVSAPGICRAAGCSRCRGR
jgi:hypothetical protein